MKNQPYIFKKQIITLTILLTLYILGYLLNLNKTFLFGLVIYMFLVFSITFIPSLPRLFKYPYWLHAILYELPFFITILWVPKQQKISLVFLISVFIITLFFVIILLLIGIKSFLKTINGFTSQVPISFSNYLLELSNTLFSIISEEVCFRGFFIGNMSLTYGPFTIIISAILFTFTHYLNRWANVTFTPRIYFIQFLLGLILGCAYYYTQSLLIVCIAHLLFDSSRIIVLTKRLSVKREQNISIFDDYD